MEKHNWVKFWSILASGLYLGEEIGDIKDDHSILWLHLELVDSVHKRCGVIHHVHGVASQRGKNQGQLLGKLVGQRPNGRHYWPHGSVVLVYQIMSNVNYQKL